MPTQHATPGISLQALMNNLNDFMGTQDATVATAINAMVNLAFNAVLADPKHWPGYLQGQEVLRQILLEKSDGRLAQAAQPQTTGHRLDTLAKQMADGVPAEAVDQLAALSIELDMWLRRKAAPVHVQMDALISLYVSIANANPEHQAAARGFGNLLLQLFPETQVAAQQPAAVSPLTH